MSTNEKNSKKGENKMSGRYINPYTDFGFKYLFGTEPNKDITLELVNALLQGKEVIKSLTLLPTEQLGDTKDDRRSVFDIYCENEQGDKIIIEMQKADQQWFKDRSVYYSSFPIRQQGEKGQWRFGLKAVYTIGILDFVFDEDKDDQKTEDELVTMTDKWLYALKHLPDLLERPKALQDRIFKKFFDVAEIAALSKEEYAKYWESEKVYYDNDGAIRTAEAKGLAKGRAEGLAEGLAEGEAKRAEERMANAKALLDNGVPLEVIVKSLHLTDDEVAMLWDFR